MENTVVDKVRLTPVVYRENFESKELCGWASYPPGQDTAYNPYVYPGEIKPGDPNISFIAMEEVHWHEDQLLGGVKLLDMVLDHSFALSFRYYIKSLSPAAYLKIHIPLETGERLIYTLDKPPANRWFGVELGWREIEKQNRSILDRERIRISALAIESKITKADPDMNVYFGLDDIELSGYKESAFLFETPEMTVLEEWPERIPLRHYCPGDKFHVAGKYDFSPETVTMTVTPFSERTNVMHETELNADDDGKWGAEALQLDSNNFPCGLYHAVISAVENASVSSETQFTFFVADDSISEKHPRLLFDNIALPTIQKRFMSKKFKAVRETFEKEAASYREKAAIETVVYDFDQFPDNDWIASLWHWFIHRVMLFREALFTNAILYSMTGDKEAGEYCRELMLALSAFPDWNHPWKEARGIHSYFPAAEMTEAFAIAYDLTYDLLSDEERSKIRSAAFENYIKPTYKTYVEHNRISTNSSNWLSHLIGGGLLSTAAFYQDSDKLDDLEPYFTGFILKEHRYIETVFGRDGSYGEGFRYYNFAMHSFARVIPMMERLFGIDLSGEIGHSWLETFWAGVPENDTLFTFGDSEGYFKGEAQASWIGGMSGPMNYFAWLVERTKDSRLSWLYHSIKVFDTFEEVLHETDDIPEDAPEGPGGVKFFRDVGTAVFRSAWSKDAFLFVFRCGPFYNHQHMDQGSFFLMDRGEKFIEERYDGDHHYYDDPLYQSHAIRTISHNTILINGNPQSQELGDPKGFAKGMNRHASFDAWLDSEHFASVSGSLGPVYYDAVSSLRRHAVYLKSDVVLLIDEIIPGEHDVDVNLLFHTQWKDQCHAETGRSLIVKDSATLAVEHLSPTGRAVTVKDDPHFLSQFDDRPLRKRGYLELSAKTARIPLIISNLMYSDLSPESPRFERKQGKGCVGGEIKNDSGICSLCINTSGDTMEFKSMKSDALALAYYENGDLFLLMGCCVTKNEHTIFNSEKPMTAAISSTKKHVSINCHLEDSSSISCFVESAPKSVTIDGVLLDTWSYSEENSCVTASISTGEHIINIQL